MNLIEFPEQTIVIAKNQPQYNPMPALNWNDTSGTITCCWKLTWKERIKVLFTGKLWHDILTFNNPVQPQRLSINKTFIMS